MKIYLKKARNITMNGENTKKENLEARLRELRSKLQANTSELGDWKVIKALEYQLAGKLIPYDMSQLNSERQAIRDEINQIESSLALLQEE
jgi:hypothetical protein|nr:MAG TPA: hypothetical protein [Caudoviricetes sp.]